MSFDVEAYLQGQRERERDLAVKEPGEHWLDVPHCPHCGARDDDWWDGDGLKNDGDQVDRECGDCGKPYSVVMCVSTEFLTSKPEQNKVRP